MEKGLILGILLISILLISGGCAETPENKDSDTSTTNEDVEETTETTTIIEDKVEETTNDDTFFEVHLSDGSEDILNIFGKDYNVKTSLFKNEAEIEIFTGSTKRSIRLSEGEMSNLHVFNFSINMTNIIPELGADVEFLKI